VIRVDLHVHTRFSGDATITPRLLVDQLYAHSFIKGVAITGHDTLQGYRSTRRMARAAYTEVSAETSVDDVLRAIKKGLVGS